MMVKILGLIFLSGASWSAWLGVNPICQELFDTNLKLNHFVPHFYRKIHDYRRFNSICTRPEWFKWHKSKIWDISYPSFWSNQANSFQSKRKKIYFFYKLKRKRNTEDRKSKLRRSQLSSTKFFYKF